MRVIRDAVGNISVDGTVVHANVRWLQNDQGQVAVFAGRSAPSATYSVDQVETTILRKPCSCKGDAPKATLTRLWENSVKAAAHAG